ncbi:hypothetical protein [Cellulomonas sp. Root137]|nr:hypothetical protein [Cellulomonas sp. Root137]
MHSDDRIVHDTGDDRPVIHEVEVEVEETDAEKIKADGIDEENAERR